MKRLSAILFLVSVVCKAQLTTSTALSTEQLITSVLVGKGVVVSNIVYIGHEDAIGSFDGSNSNIGIDNGIIISTGTVKDKTSLGGRKDGPIGPNNNNSQGSDWKRVGDSDLTDLIADQTNDAAIIEFDFIPQGDLIEFEYVFASEEYLEQANNPAGFFDVFAFFISGPGIVGQENLAVVPGTNEVISIETINDQKNSHLYIDNGTGQDELESTFTDETVTNFDGFTIPLTATKEVVPCQTYHLKIAIADVRDGLFDSGVFLKGGSLNSSPLYEPNQSSTVDVGTLNLLPEGCSDGVLELTRTEDLDQVLSLNYRVLGTAENGVDYTVLPSVVSFGINETSKTIRIESIVDGFPEQEEQVILRFPNPNICDLDSVDYEFTITDIVPVTSNPQDVFTECPGEEVQLQANFQGGFAPFTYEWDNGDNTVITNLSPLTSETIEFKVTDVCGEETTNEINVIVPLFSPLALSMSQDTSVVCAGLMVPVSGNASGGAGGYNYLWETGEKTSSILPQIVESKHYVLQVTDKCGVQITDSVEVQLNYTDIEVQIASDTIVCPGDVTEFNALVTGGIPPYSYEWENGTLNSSAIFSSDESTIISISVMDSCNIIAATDSVELKIQVPKASFIPGSNRLESGSLIRFVNNSQGAVESYHWDLGNGELSTETNASTIYTTDSTYVVKLLVTDSLGCVDSISQEIVVVPPLYLWVPNAFTPNVDGNNNIFHAKGVGISSYEMYVFSRWGEKIFYTNDFSTGWNGEYMSGRKAPEGVYVYRINVVGENGKEIKKIGSVTLLR